MTKSDQVIREALRVMHSELPFLAGGSIGIMTKPKKAEMASRPKTSTFPNGSNSPLWFFGFR